MASTHMVSSRESLPDEVALDILHRSKSPDSGMHTSQSSQEGTPPCNVLEKITDDGYNWRKYGQKNVKGNEFVRSYYKCTHFKCLVKKRVERSRDGQIKDTIYFGGHCHPITQSLPPIAATLALSGPEEKPNVPLLADTDEKAAEEHGRSIQLIQPMDLTPRCTILANDDGAEVTPLPLTRKRDEVDKDEESQVKRQKKECSRGNTTPRDKPTCEPRVVVQTLSEIDIVSDGYRWRKYGQKFVKGNPNPRSYYRCSSAGCPVKKHVERASYDPKVVITTYEGQHDHNIPPARIVTVTHHTSGESSTKSLASDIVVYTPTSINTRSTEQLKGEARSHAIDFIAYTPTSSNIKSTEQLNCESRAHASEIVAYTPTSPNTRSTEQLNGESRSISHDIDTGCLGDVLINHCPDTDNVCSDPLAIEPKKNAEENLTVSSDMVVTTDMVSEKLYGSMCNKSEETQRLHHGNSMVRKVEESKTVCCDVVTCCFPVPKNNSIELRVVEPQNNSEELAIIGRDQNKSSEQVNGKVRLNVSEGNGILSHDTVHRTVSITESNSNSLRSESEQNVKVNPNTAVRVSSCPEQVPNSQQTVKAEPVQI